MTQPFVIIQSILKQTKVLELVQLIEKCKKSDRKSQQALYNMYKDRLFALCLKYCKNRAEAEDNLQDSFIKIFQSIKTYNGKGSFEGWMKRITINRAIDRYKKEPFIEPITDQHLKEDTTVDIDEAPISLQQMLALIQELPSRYRLVFNLYELDNHTHVEISEILGISVGTSKSNLHRAKLILKEKITATRTTTQKNSIVNG
ncbi:DNA-directed RNA polymerase sigma-70 factor [Dokdonia pacifica]|uniref:RNA polymerase sigma-70 factor, ECF subfamily n=1 Tax=Dokdonia pacifica TaxID=1627892 RepID=A0A239C6L7_9FLAO|nr:RNA polymerase sigma factor [Dokdonia pacifica]GGG26606.1 DNA-directed RNA polymerase sigma-70 factor [Dokdonia pacifica]SNS15023.1 RNA polymerase sigma-70 factor, ECF subfamily [Dokdonia pacifica]